jgi:hypothetical protein
MAKELDPPSEAGLHTPPPTTGPGYAAEPGFEPRTFLELDEQTQNRLIFREREAAYRLLEAGELKPYRGLWVAILCERVVGSGKDEWSLRQQVAREYRTHPNRPWLIDVDPEDVPCQLHVNSSQGTAWLEFP